MRNLRITTGASAPITGAGTTVVDADTGEDLGHCIERVEIPEFGSDDVVRARLTLCASADLHVQGDFFVLWRGRVRQVSHIVFQDGEEIVL